MTIHPFAVLLIAMGAVLGGVLVLRLHAFLALTLGAFLVACLTPRYALHDEVIRDRGAVVEQLALDGKLELANVKSLPTGRYLAFRPRGTRRQLEQVAWVEILSVTPESSVVMSTMPRGDADESLKLQAGDLLVTWESAQAAATAAKRSVGARLADGFGSTCASIGLLIAMASIIGKCLLQSRAAERIVTTIRTRLGDRLTPLALAVSSFIVAIPVFFDTVFFLMIPLAKELAGETRRNYLLYVLSIVAGGSIAHSLVPPTPGPLFVATALDVNIGLMILGGGAVATCGVALAFPYILWANRRWQIPVRDDDAEAEAVNSNASDSTAREELADAQNGDPQTVGGAYLPPFWLAMLPIILPVLLIAGRTVFEAIAGSELALADSPWLARALAVFAFAGDKNIALMIAAAVALATLWSRPGADRAAIRPAVQEALASAGVIILITAAGGSFGSVLRSTGIAAALQDTMPPSGSGVALLLMAFGLTSLVRVAQGSATVAMIAAVGIVAPLAGTIELPYHPLYLALAIGAGSKPLPWMNDSGFWIVGKMSGLTEGETLRTFTVVLTLMGLGCLAATVAGAMLLPLK